MDLNFGVVLKGKYILLPKQIMIVCETVVFTDSLIKIMSYCKFQKARPFPPAWHFWNYTTNMKDCKKYRLKQASTIHLYLFLWLHNQFQIQPPTSISSLCKGGWVNIWRSSISCERASKWLASSLSSCSRGSLAWWYPATLWVLRIRYKCAGYRNICVFGTSGIRQVHYCLRLMDVPWLN